MKKIEFTRFIERYLDGQMQNSEKKWFEAEMEGNPSLRKEMELRKRVNGFIEDQDSVAFRKILMDAEKKHRNIAAVRNKVATKRVIQYVAVFAGLMLLGYAGLLFTGNNDTDYASMYSPDYTPLTTARSMSDEMDNAYLKATEFYKSGNYEEAIVWFNKLLNPDMQVEFLKGNSYMKISEYREAIVSYTKVVDDNDNLFIEDARFYLSVCYLETEQSDKAKALLEGIMNSESRYKKDAKKLLKKIS